MRQLIADNIANGIPMGTLYFKDSKGLHFDGGSIVGSPFPIELHSSDDIQFTGFTLKREQDPNPLGYFYTDLRSSILYELYGKPPLSKK